jgi:hypothetical protein
MSGFQSKRRMSLFKLNDEDQSFWRRAMVVKKFALVPRRCYETNKWIVGPVYRACAIWTGPSEPIHEYRWYSKEEYLLGVLKGKYVKDNQKLF